jgi:hypothetical protein
VVALAWEVVDIDLVVAFAWEVVVDIELVVVEPLVVPEEVKRLHLVVERC